MRERPILIAYRRFEQLQELLFARGYLIDPGGRDPNEWRDDPPLGLVRLKSVALENAYEEQGYWRFATASTPSAIRRCPTTAIPRAATPASPGGVSAPRKRWKVSMPWWLRSGESDGCSEPLEIALEPYHRDMTAAGAEVAFR